MDFALPARPVRMSLLSGRGHYDQVIRAVRGARTSVWIATANLKELLVEDTRATARARARFHSVLAVLDGLASQGVELRILHASAPSGPFRSSFDRRPRLVAGGLELRQCPRVHLKTVLVDGRLCYLGSANWTGAACRRCKLRESGCEAPIDVVLGTAAPARKLRSPGPLVNLVHPSKPKPAPTTTRRKPPANTPASPRRAR